MREGLAEAGVGVAHVDDVIVSHVHDDHLGLLVTSDLGPRFPNARYVVHRADWDAIQNDDPEDVGIFERTLRPLERHGVLQLIDGPLAVTPSLRLQPAPGHTPGHQCCWSRVARFCRPTRRPSGARRRPELVGTTDADHELAATTRRRLLDEAERDGRAWIASHFAVPFGRIVTEDGRRMRRAT